MLIRTAVKQDITSLVELFESSVGEIAPEYYSAKQVSAWIASTSDVESFRKFILEATTFVAEKNNLILGFGGIKQTGYLSSLYVRGNYNRQGVGSQLVTCIIEYARINKIDRIYTEASEFSKPLFKKFDFTIYEEEEINRHGVIFHRYLMEKQLY